MFLILQNPKIPLLYMAVFFLPFTYLRFPFNIKITEGIVLAIIFLLILSARQTKFYPTPIFLPMTLVIIIGILSLWKITLIPEYIYNKPWAHGRYHPYFSGVLTIARYIFLTIFVIVVVNLISKNVRRLQKVLKIYLIAGGTVSLIGIMQLIGYITGISYFAYFTEIFSKGWEGTTLVPQRLGEIVIPRIMGPNNEPKMFANTLVSIIPFTLAAIIWKWNILKRKTLWLLLILQIFAIFLTFSASGWFALILSISAIFLFLSESKKIKWSLLISLVIGSILILSSFSEIISIAISFNVDRTLNYFTSPAAIGQLDPFLAGLEMFKEYPVFGVGIGNYPFYYPEYNILNLPEVDYAVLASNEFISILAETGLLGALSWIPFILVILSFFREAKQFRGHDAFLYSLFIASLAATIGCWGQLWATYGILNPHIWFPIALAITSRRLLRKETIDAAEKETT